jgi:hypothetical protein
MSNERIPVWQSFRQRWEDRIRRVLTPLTPSAETTALTPTPGDSDQTLRDKLVGALVIKATSEQINITGNAGTATALATARNINGVPFDGTAAITVSAAAATLTGLGTGVASALASNVTGSGGLVLSSGMAEKVSHFANVAALAANTGTAINWPNGSIVQLGGYVSNGDGGGGLYRANSSAASPYPFITTAGGVKFQAVFDGLEVPVQRFGARCDGTTDDTAAVVAAALLAESIGSGGVGGTVVFPPGACLFSSVTLTNASIRGAGSQYKATPAINGTVLVQTDSATNDMIIMTGDGRGSSVSQVCGVGKNDSTIKGKVAITAATGRTSYSVAPANLPTSTPYTSFPFYGPCFFYSNEGKYIGAGIVQTINAGTGEFTLFKGTDCYAYRTGSVTGLLTTADFVVFSPAETIAGKATNFPSPCSAGPAFISIQGNKKSVTDVSAYFWHTGLKLGPYLLPQVNNFKSGQCTFAGIGNHVNGGGADDLMDNLFLTGGPYNSSSGGVAEINTWVDAAYRLTFCGQWGTRAAANYGRLVVDGAVFGVVDVGGTSSISYDTIFIDHVVRNGIQSFAIGISGLGSSWSQPTLSINQLYARTPYDSSWLTVLPTTYLNGVGTQPVPGRDVINNQSQGRVISIGTFSSERHPSAPSSASDWGYLCSIGVYFGAPYNRVMVGNMINPGFTATQGYTTQNGATSTAWELANPGAAVSAGIAGAGWFKLSTGAGQMNGIGLSIAGAEVLRYNSSGLRIGGAADPVASALLQLSSTTRGFLPPSMTTTQRDAISSPAEGLVLFNTTTSKLQVRAGATWVDMTRVLRGTGTLVAGTVTIANTSVTASSIIIVTGQNDSGGVSSHGSLTIGTRVPGTSFVINSSIATDTRLVGYVIVEP